LFQFEIDAIEYENRCRELTLAPGPLPFLDANGPKVPA